MIHSLIGFKLEVSYSGKVIIGRAPDTSLMFENYSVLIAIESYRIACHRDGDHYRFSSWYICEGISTRSYRLSQHRTPTTDRIMKLTMMIMPELDGCFI